MTNKKSILRRFKETFDIKNDEDGCIESGVSNKADVIAIVFDWDNWVEKRNFVFGYNEFDATPIGVTGRSLGDEDPIDVTIFSNGENRAYYKDEYLDKIKNFIGYDPKSNLNKLKMIDSTNGPLMLEADEYDILLANRIPPNDL